MWILEKESSMDRVFEIFEEIMGIPRESGNEAQIANYLVSFARKANLEVVKDKFNNIFIRKNNDSKRTIILQAHSDMVCVSNKGYDFENKGIDYYIDGDYYKARDTSLGADDGIGVAIILAMLEENIKLPNIEAMITTSEETSMEGAINYNYGLLTGDTLISLDGIKEGDIESSTAGMCSLTLNKKLEFNKASAKSYKMVISNLAGGHSGDDIDKKRCNAIKLIAKFVSEIGNAALVDINAGEKDNVIPNFGYCTFNSYLDLDTINQKIKAINLDLMPDDKNIKIELCEVAATLQLADSSSIIEFINELEDGLIESFKDDNFPMLSSNIGKVAVFDKKLVVKVGIRSSDDEKLESQLNKIKLLADKYNFALSVDVNKPFLAFKEKSAIRGLLLDAYEELFGKKAIIKKVHACMESGIIFNNIKNLDICTIAPTISDCHTIKEKVSISSTTRVYNWLKLALQKYNAI